MKKKMFLGADHLVFKNAESLRWNMTPAEMVLWNRLKEKQLGVKFRRQHPLVSISQTFIVTSINW